MVSPYNYGEAATLKLKLLLFDTLTQQVREQSNTGKHCRLACFIHYRCVDDNSWLLVEILLYVHRNCTAYWGREPKTATSTFTQLLNYGNTDFGSMLLYVHRNRKAH